MLGSPFWRCFVGVQLPVVWTRSLRKNSTKKCDGDTETPQRDGMFSVCRAVVKSMIVQHGLAISDN